MTDNARNDKYSLPLIQSITKRLNNTPPNLTWLVDRGNPEIDGNIIILHENTGDITTTDSNNQFDLVYHGYYFQCVLPEFTNDNNSLYVGGNWYGAYIDNENQLFTYNQNIINTAVTYIPGDLYQQVYDGVNVNFYLNGLYINSVPLLENYSSDYLYCGLDTSNPTQNIYTINKIYGYVTGRNGANGDDGTNGVNILSGSGVPSNTLGVDGEYYMDILTFTMYGPKSNSWVSKKPVDPVPSIKTLSSGGTTKLWDFIDGYTNILIYLVFAESSSERQPDKIVQISVQCQGGGPQYVVFGTLPSNVSITTVTNGSTEQSINIQSSGSPAYNYIGVKIQTIA